MKYAKLIILHLALYTHLLLGRTPLLYAFDNKGLLEWLPDSIRCIFDAKKIDPVPFFIINTAQKMDFVVNPNKIFSSPSIGYNAGARMNNTIIVGDSLLNTSKPEEMEFIIGHEIAHIQKRHQLKTVVFIFGIAAVKGVFDKLMTYVEKKYYPEEGSYGYYLFMIGKKIQHITDNRVIYFLLLISLRNLLACYFEKEADLVSAAKTGRTKEAIDFFERCQRAESNQAYAARFKAWLLATLSAPHPSHETRIAYLKELASSNP